MKKIVKIVAIVVAVVLVAAFVAPMLLRGKIAQIVKRDENSWLVEGSTSLYELENTFDLPDIEDNPPYETAGGLVMFLLRRIPKRTDKLTFGGYQFEVVDVDKNRVDQLLATKLPKGGIPKTSPDTTADTKNQTPSGNTPQDISETH